MRKSLRVEGPTLLDRKDPPSAQQDKWEKTLPGAFHLFQTLVAKLATKVLESPWDISTATLENRSQ